MHTHIFTRTHTRTGLQHTHRPLPAPSRTLVPCPMLGAHVQSLVGRDTWLGRGEW